MVYAEIAFVAVIATIAGFFIGFMLSRVKRFSDFLSRDERLKRTIMKNPELLLQKLKEHGPIIDMGDEIKLSIEEKNGKRRIVSTRIKNEDAKTINVTNQNVFKD